MEGIRSYVTLNIGLAVSTDPNFPQHPEVLAAVTGERVQVALAILTEQDETVIEPSDWRVDRTGAEPTLVVQVDRFTRQHVYDICSALRQDCIAIRDQAYHIGELIGPREYLWGPFDNSKFIEL